MHGSVSFLNGSLSKSCIKTLVCIKVSLNWGREGIMSYGYLRFYSNAGDSTLGTLIRTQIFLENTPYILPSILFHIVVGSRICNERSGGMWECRQSFFSFGGPPRVVVFHRCVSSCVSSIARGIKMVICS